MRVNAHLRMQRSRCQSPPDESCVRYDKGSGQDGAKSNNTRTCTRYDTRGGDEASTTERKSTDMGRVLSVDIWTLHAKKAESPC